MLVFVTTSPLLPLVLRFYSALSFSIFLFQRSWFNDDLSFSFSVFRPYHNQSDFLSVTLATAEFWLSNFIYRLTSIDLFHLICILCIKSRYFYWLYLSLITSLSLISMCHLFYWLYVSLISSIFVDSFLSLSCKLLHIILNWFFTMVKRVLYFCLILLPHILINNHPLLPK